jgi:hypothetical protein
MRVFDALLSLTGSNMSRYMDIFRARFCSFAVYVPGKVCEALCFRSGDTWVLPGRAAVVCALHHACVLSGVSVAKKTALCVKIWSRFRAYSVN